EIVPDECGFIDCQKLRLQELPEDVPTGEIPCHLSLSVDRSLVNVVTAGTRVRVIGIFSVFQPKPRFGKSKKSAPSSVSYLRVVGLEQLSEGMSLQKHPFSVAEEEEMIALSKDPKIYEKLAQSLAPKIYGHEDIKKAIVCLLFGGTKKILPSRSRIRGDINILLLG
ncbi:minichromosome maintenance protein 5, partial [Bonamia ostreae]